MPSSGRKYSLDVQRALTTTIELNYVKSVNFAVNLFGWSGFVMVAATMLLSNGGVVINGLTVTVGCGMVAEGGRAGMMLEVATRLHWWKGSCRLAGLTRIVAMVL